VKNERKEVVTRYEYETPSEIIILEGVFLILGGKR